MANKLHLREIDWVIYFPATGNEGRQAAKYGVAFLDRRTGRTQPGPRINLADVLQDPAVRDRYPHTAGLFEVATGKGRTWRPHYQETRTLQNEQELLAWIASLEGIAAL